MYPVNILAIEGSIEIIDVTDTPVDTSITQPYDIASYGLYAGIQGAAGSGMERQV